MAILLPPEQLPNVLQLMIKYPETRSHMLFLGPPGSSKTTTAQSFATAIHGDSKNRFASVLFLNSSDERSLDTMRQKVYPFVESRMQSLFFSGDPPPKIIIFDEAETLTDQAQCALRSLLQRSVSEVIIIFICNSLSHIHPQIFNKFLIVPFTPTSQQNLNTITGLQVPLFDTLFRRGDIRFFKQCPKDGNMITSFLVKALHVKNKNDLFDIFNEPGSPFRERVTWFLLFFQMNDPTLSPSEIRLWSALTSSETQPFLSEEYVKDILWKLWKRRLFSFIGKKIET